jgi:hypothetical protein
MDCRRQTKSFLIGSVIVAASFTTLLVLAANTPALRAARWLPVDRQTHALGYQPGECLLDISDQKTARSISIGRAAFRTPLLLGGQAARAGLSCNSCHRNGRGNPDFMFSGLSGEPGTADVTSSLMSSHRGDGINNPTLIPDLSGPTQGLKISRDKDNQALEKFIRGLIIEEFDGAEPSKMTVDGLASYVRALSPTACEIPTEQKIRLTHYLSDARSAMQAAQIALDAHDPATTRLMIASARSALGMIHERYAAENLSNDRQLLQTADLELAAIQHALDAGEDDISMRIATWQATMPRWTSVLEYDENLSLFNSEHITSIR